MRVLLATTGSLGDLFPVLAVARGLQARGHRAVLATTRLYRDRVEAAGVAFAPLRPDPPEGGVDPAAYARIMDPLRGPAVVWREIVAPAIRDSHADLLAAACGADLILSHPIVPAGPMVAEALGLPWAPVVLQPGAFLSARDPSVFAGYTWLGAAPPLLRLAAPLLRRTGLAMLRRWTRPVAALRRELGLDPARDPLLHAARPPRFGLALFSPLLAAPQPDWPPGTRPSGFPFWDEPGVVALPPDLAAFLAAGPPPLVFTLGSTAVHAPGAFYRESLEVARLLGRRAVLLGATGLPPGPLPGFALAVPYAPHGLVFPAACATVHQGGIGTCAQAMRAGRPMLVTPFSHDQPDNAARLGRLGVAATLPPRRYTAARAARALARLLDDAEVIRRAAALGAAIRAEDGVAGACDAVEAAMAAPPPFPSAPAVANLGSIRARGF